MQIKQVKGILRVNSITIFLEKRTWRKKMLSANSLSTRNAKESQNNQDISCGLSSHEHTFGGSSYALHEKII